MGKVMMISVSLLTFFIVVFFGERGMVAEERHELSLLADAMIQDKATIEEWSILMKDRWTDIESEEELNQRLKELKKDLPTFTWKKQVSNNGVIKWIGMNSEPHEWQENLQVLYPPTTSEASILFEVKGTGWNEQIIRQMYISSSDRKNDIFHAEPTNFTCIKGYFSDNIDSGLFTKSVKFLQHFQAKPIEWLNEEAFVSVSAYTGEWKDVLSTGTNIQIAMRAGLGGRTTVVVGTPIITSEY